MTQPSGPGWYPDYTQPGALRWFDGRNWTDQIVAAPAPRPQRRPIIFGPLLALAGVAVLVFFILSHPSVSVPLAGVQECGGTSLGVALTSNAQIRADARRHRDDLGDEQLVAQLEHECVRKGRANLYKGAGALIVGLVAGGMVARYERNR